MEDRKTYIVANGQRFGPFMSVPGFQYGPAGSSYYALVHEEENNDMATYVLWNGRVLGPYEEIVSKNSQIRAPDLETSEDRDGMFFWSPDGSRLAFRIRRSSGRRTERIQEVVMVINGEAGGPYEETSPPIFSPDGEHTAYCALPLRRIGDSSPRSEVIVLDGQEMEPVHSVHWQCFDHNSNLWSHVLGRSIPHRDDFVLKNGERVFDLPSEVRWCCSTVDSKHLVSWQQSGFRVDGVPISSQLPGAGGGQMLGLTLSNFDPRFGPPLPYTGNEELTLFLTRRQPVAGQENTEIHKLVIDLTSL